MSEIQEHEVMWYPGIYAGREGEYLKEVVDTSIDEIVKLVQVRAEEDGQWSIDNGHVGDNEEVMRQMMAWVSKPTNIQQCVAYILEHEPDAERTVDFVCRDLANASKGIMGSNSEFKPRDNRP